MIIKAVNHDRLHYVRLVTDTIEKFVLSSKGGSAEAKNTADPASMPGW